MLSYLANGQPDGLSSAENAWGRFEDMGDEQTDERRNSIKSLAIALHKTEYEAAVSDRIEAEADIYGAKFQLWIQGLTIAAIISYILYDYLNGYKSILGVLESRGGLLALLAIFVLVGGWNLLAYDAALIRRATADARMRAVRQKIQLSARLLASSPPPGAH